MILLVAKLDLPGVCEAQSTCVQDDIGLGMLNEEPEDQGKVSLSCMSG